MLECKNGHTLPINFDSNECGCHHKGKPCIIISCHKCFEESMKEYKKGRDTNKINIERVYIPLDEDGMKELKKLLDNS